MHNDHRTVTMWASTLMKGSLNRSAEHTLHAPAVRAAWKDGYRSPVTNVGWLHWKTNKKTNNPPKDVVFTEFMRRWGVLLFFVVVFWRQISQVLLYDSKSITLPLRQRGLGENKTSCREPIRTKDSLEVVELLFFMCNVQTKICYASLL